MSLRPALSTPPGSSRPPNLDRAPDRSSPLPRRSLSRRNAPNRGEPRGTRPGRAGPSDGVTSSSCFLKTSTVDLLNRPAVGQADRRVPGAVHDRHSRDSRVRAALVSSTLEPMSVTIELPADVLARLEAEAARRGVGIDAVVAELVDALCGGATAERAGHRFAFTGAVASGDGTLSERYKTIRRAEFAP